MDKTSSNKRGTTTDRPPAVLCMADYLARNHVKCTSPRCRAWHEVTKPQGARPADMYVCSEIVMPEQFRGTRRGDLLIYLVTNDVGEGDLVTLRWRKLTYTGFLEIIEGGRWMLTDTGGEPLSGPFAPDDVLLIGRCVEVQRKGRRVEIARELRPAHEDLLTAA